MLKSLRMKLVSVFAILVIALAGIWVYKVSTPTGNDTMTAQVAPPASPPADPGQIVAMSDKFPNPVYGAGKRVAAACKGAATPCFWDDATTWTDSAVPTLTDKVIVDGNVQIRTTDAVADSVGAYPGGTLSFSPTANTQLKVTNLFVFDGGTLTIGTQNQPIGDAVTASLILRDTPLNFSTNDPALYLTTLTAIGGKVQIFGHAFADTFLQVAAEVPKGATTATLISSPAAAGWRVGDTISIPRSAQCAHESGDPCDDQSEDAKLTAIAGNTITFSALAFAHPGAKDINGHIDFLPHFIDRTRNVIIRSENPAGTRGHVLFTGRADVDVRYAEFDGLGRTSIADIAAAASATTNVKGRYPLHAHHLIGPVTPQANGYQYTFVGNSIDFGPGNDGADGKKWGIAIHDSHYGLIENNIVYRAAGGGIVSETGYETGNMFKRNFVARVVGGNGERTDDRAFDNTKQFRAGVGYYLDASDKYEDNFAAGGLDKGRVYYYGFKLDIVNPGTGMVPTAQGNDPMVSGQGKSIAGNAIPFNGFIRNTVYGMANGLTFWWICVDYETPKLGCSSTIKDFHAWNNWRWDIFGYENYQMTIDGFVARGDPAVLTNTYENPTAFWNADYGAISMVIKNANIQNMGTGILPPLDVGRPGHNLKEPSPFTIDGGIFKNRTNIPIQGICSVNGPNLLGRKIIVQNVTFGRPPTISSTAVTNLEMSNYVYSGCGTANTSVANIACVNSYNNVSTDNFQLYGKDQPHTCTTTRPNIDGYVCPQTADCTGSAPPAPGPVPTSSSAPASSSPASASSAQASSAPSSAMASSVSSSKPASSAASSATSSRPASSAASSAASSRPSSAASSVASQPSSSPSSATPTPPSPNGLLAWWKFDATATDSSGNGDDGTLVGNPIYVPGRFGSAISFNSQAQYMVSKDNVFNSVLQTTIAFWAKTNANTHVNAFFNYSSPKTSVCDKAFEMEQTNGNIFQIWGSRGKCATSFNLKFKLTTPNDWHHYAYVVSATGNALYVDGVKVKPTYVAGSPSSTFSLASVAGASTTMRAGGSTDDAEYDDGFIDDMRVYNRPLSAGEILGLVNGQ